MVRILVQLLVLQHNQLPAFVAPFRPRSAVILVVRHIALRQLQFAETARNRPLPALRRAVMFQRAALDFMPTRFTLDQRMLLRPVRLQMRFRHGIAANRAHGHVLRAMRYVNQIVRLRNLPFTKK